MFFLYLVNVTDTISSPRWAVHRSSRSSNGSHERQTGKSVLPKSRRGLGGDGRM